MYKLHTIVRTTFFCKYIVTYIRYRVRFMFQLAESAITSLGTQVALYLCFLHREYNCYRARLRRHQHVRYSETDLRVLMVAYPKSFVQLAIAIAGATATAIISVATKATQ